MPAVLDDSAWPILRNCLTPVTIEAFDEFATWHTAALERATALGVYLYAVSDARGQAPSLEVVRHIARWQATLTNAQFERCALNVVVVNNALIRRAMTTINWFKAPLTPQLVVATHREAWVAVVEDLEKRNQPIPPAPPWADLT